MSKESEEKEKVQVYKLEFNIDHKDGTSDVEYLSFYASESLAVAAFVQWFKSYGKNVKLLKALEKVSSREDVNKLLAENKTRTQKDARIYIEIFCINVSEEESKRLFEKTSKKRKNGKIWKT